MEISTPSPTNKHKSQGVVSSADSSQVLPMTNSINKVVTNETILRTGLMKYVVKQLREGYYPTPHFWRSEKLIF
jgi:hypothetical protein